MLLETFFKHWISVLGTSERCPALRQFYFFILTPFLNTLVQNQIKTYFFSLKISLEPPLKYKLFLKQCYFMCVQKLFPKL